MKKLVKLTLLGVILIPLAIVGSPVAAEGEELSLAILSVGYTDLDEDGLEDDIYIEFNFAYNAKNDGVVKFELYCQIGLPSTASHKSLYYISTNYQSLSLRIHAFNTATEPGDYKLDMIGVLKGNGGAPTVTTASIIFDPPGGTSGDPFYKIFMM